MNGRGETGEKNHWTLDRPYSLRTGNQSVSSSNMSQSPSDLRRIGESGVEEHPPVAEPTDSIECATAANGTRAAYGDELNRHSGSGHPSGARRDSKVLSLPCNHRSSIRAVRNSRFFRNAHSQTIATLHPASRSRCRFRVSRFTLPRNFACQNSLRVAGVVAYEHPACRCQKQP